jgi:hypothetical protein
MKKQYTILALVVSFAIFIGVIALSHVYEISELPMQVVGALFGAVVAAMITYFLLEGQTSQEELKEKNVKVFEKKSEMFNGFIEKLWEIWEDRSVVLEEISELIKLVSKDIIPYAKPESSEAILKELNTIADFTNLEKNKKSNKEIQKSVFEIINVLSKEIGLGGEIKSEISEQLNLLENKVLPVLNRNNYISVLNKNITKLGLDQFHWEEDPRYSCEVLWTKLKNGMWLRIGDVRNEGYPTYITFWSNRKYSQYHDYRYAQNGKDRDWLKDYKKLDDFDFNAIRNGEQISTDGIKTLADKIVEFYQEWEVEGKTIDAITNVCDK